LKKIFLPLFLCFFAFSTFVFGQINIQQRITRNFDKVTLLEILQGISESSATKFYFDPYILPYYKISYRFNDRTLIDILTKILPEHGLTYAVAHEGIVILQQNNMNRAYIQDIVKRTNEGKLQLPDTFRPVEMDVLIGESSTKVPKEIEISGILTEEESKEPAIGATIQIENTKSRGTATNALGQYKLKVPSGLNTLTIKYLGFKIVTVKLEAYKSGTLDVAMQSQAFALQEFVVQGGAAANKITSTGTGLEALSVQLVKELPSFVGQADIIKSLTLLPGVSTAGEAASGINVRGGSTDQNLTLQDDVPLFNTSHVLGFFSNYNPEVVKNITLYKGFIPAQYGGRSSAVLDVQLKDGNFQKFTGSAGMGMTTSNFMLEGPIVKDKTAIVIGARASYSDWLLKLARLPEARQSSAYFYDGLIKLTHRFSDKLRLNGYYYRSYDYFRFAKQFGYAWATNLGNVSLQKTWSKTLNATFTASAGDYGSDYFAFSGFNAFNLSNGIRYYIGKTNFLWIPNEKHEVKMGFSGEFRNILPDVLTPIEQSIIQPRTAIKDKGIEWATYIQDDYKLTEKITVAAGLRISAYQALGAKTEYIYRDGLPITNENLTDSITHKAGRPYKTYAGLEPRFSLGYQFADNQSVKMSYNRTRQYVHLISNTTAATPSDIWQAVNTYIPPQVTNSYSAGWFGDFSNKMWETAFEIYYKNTDDIVLYKDFPELLVNSHIETELLHGKSYSYGAESSVKKQSGKLTGLLSYTYARAFQKAVSSFDGEVINGNAWYRADYDQPHQVNMYAKWTITPARALLVNFVYRTGRPISAPANSFEQSGVVIPSFTERNNYRIPDYQRLDLSYTFDRGKSKLRGLKWSMSASLYNVLGRQNAFSVYFKRDVNLVVRAYKLAAIGSAIPGLNFNVNF
jgi:TonB dependent receptor/CarboxypepD_reg-like domain/TonB-dependent Receptor Plug Domain